MSLRILEQVIVIACSIFAIFLLVVLIIFNMTVLIEVT